MSESAQQPREALIEAFRENYGLVDLPPADLDLALTHRSHAFEANLPADNERLEFLGDAVLAAVCSEHLYRQMPAAAEGDLSKLRSRVVSRALLGRRAEEMGIGPLMLLGRGERQTGGARRRSVLGSALEALIGAIHLRLGPAASDRFARQCVIAPILEKIQGDEAPGDSKSALQEWSQRVHGCVPEYRRISDSGPDHAKAFAVEVSVAGRTLARGEGPRIKSAENQAARRALEAIEKDGLQITKGG